MMQIDQQNSKRELTEIEIRKSKYRNQEIEIEEKYYGKKKDYCRQLEDEYDSQPGGRID